MQSNDQFEVQIDSYHDHRTAFVFGVTPAGGRNDLVAPNDGFQGIDAGWDPVWDAATRVGPAILNPARWDGNLWWNGDGRNAVSGGIYVSYGSDEEGAYLAAIAPSIRGRGQGWFSWSFSPRLSRSRSTAFYVAQVPDPLAGPTYNTRYLFAALERATLSMTARTDLALTPRMTLQVYAEPFVSTGEYEDFSALKTSGTYDFLRYGEAGSTISQDGDFFSVDADGPGPARAIRFRNPDFRVRSFRSNLVLRWEYLPGSALFVVWTQDRAGQVSDSHLEWTREMRDLFDDPMRNVLLVKASYWLNF